jgi:hypothetical protein
MNNEGLDALAALAAVASNTPCPPVVSSASNNNDGGHKEKSKDEKSSNRDSSQTVDPTMPGITAQQWQQAIANAAASINVLAGGNNQNNLALLGLQQLNYGQAAANPGLVAIQQQLAMQQQLSYYQLLAHAASQQQRQFVSNPGATLQQQNLVPPSAIGVNGAATPATSISQVLGVHPQHLYPNLNGK